MMIFLAAGLGLLIGAGLAYALLAGRLGRVSGEAEEIRLRVAEGERLRQQAEGQVQAAREGVVRAEAERQAAERSLQESRQEKEQLATRLQTELRAMAQQMVAEGTRQLAQDNRTQVGIELRPLLDRIEAFRKRTDEIHTAETGLQSDLRREIQQIQAMSTQLGTETHRLTHALKNDSGTRGRW